MHIFFDISGDFVVWVVCVTFSGDFSAVLTGNFSAVFTGGFSAGLTGVFSLKSSDILSNLRTLTC